MTDPTTLEKLRPCGRLETFSTARHHLGFYKNVGFTAEYTLSEKPEISLESQVYIALRYVVVEHSHLSAIPLNADQSYPNVYFARLPEIDLRRCVELRERKTPFRKNGEADGELDELLAEQHSRDFKEELGSRPFWRLIVLRSQSDKTRVTATWIWHHALADGASALLFHESFLAGLNSAETTSDANPLVRSPTTDLLPPLEDLHPMPISWSFFLSAVLGSLLLSLFAKRPAKLWTGNTIPADVSTIPRPRYRTLVLSAEDTRKLAQASRKEKTSVTATLQCLLAASLFNALPATEYDRLKIQGPISMKRFLDVEEKQMTNAITTYSYLHSRCSSAHTKGSSASNVLQNFSWNEARAVKFTITSEVSKSGTDSPISLLRYVSDMPKYLLEKLGKPRDPTTEISNVGVWQGKKEPRQKCKVGRMTFSQCPNLVTGAFAVSAVTGGDGNAVLNFCWCEGAVEEEMMQKVVEGVREGVDGLVGGLDA
jgi:hypothetical protein